MVGRGRRERAGRPASRKLKLRGHGRGPKPLEVVPGWPTGSGISGGSRSGDRNGGGSVNAVQRRARKRALRWTLHVVCSVPFKNVGNAGGAVFGADVVPRRATPPISTDPSPAQGHHCPNSVLVLLVCVGLLRFGLQGGSGGLGSGRGAPRLLPSPRRPLPKRGCGTARRGDTLGLSAIAVYSSLFFCLFLGMGLVHCVGAEELGQ